jgi:dihydroorotase
MAVPHDASRIQDTAVSFNFKMSTLLIHGGRVISPEDGIDHELDVWVEDGVIRLMDRQISTPADETLDAHKQIVSPGFIDLHVHFREPGGEDSETLKTGLEAAVAGGFTAVCPMPNTQPVNDSPELTRFMVGQACQIGLARIFPVAAATLQSEGAQLTDFAALAAAGAVAFSDDGRPLKTASLMRQALDRAGALGLPIIDHCEDPALSAGGVINQGPIAEKLGLPGIPNESEDACVARDLALAAETGAPLHLAHLSTASSIQMVREAKRNGVRVTCEVTPHHFTLTEKAVEQYGANAKMNPPLRSAKDRDAVLEGIADGTVDVIATDHAPHAPKLKSKSIAAAPFGVIGLETALGLAIAQLVDPGRISLVRLIELFSSHPARIIHQSLGRLRVGEAADITIFDPRREWTYHAAEGKSKSRNSPFDGWKLKGAVTATLVSGKIVYRRADKSATPLRFEPAQKKKQAQQ